MVLGDLEVYMQKKEFGPMSHTIYKCYSKSIQDLNVGAKIIKLLEWNRGENHHDLGLGKKFLRTTPKAQSFGFVEVQNPLAFG